MVVEYVFFLQCYFIKMLTIEIFNSGYTVFLCVEVFRPKVIIRFQENLLQ